MKKTNYFLPKFALFLIIVFSLSSCYEMKYTYRSKTSRISEPTYSGHITPWVADIQIISTEKITYSEVFNVLLNNFTNDNTIEPYKNYIIGVASKKNNADIILAPLFEVETTDEGFLKITITGYPAKFVNFRNATPNDEWFVNPNYKNVIKK